MEGSTFSKLIGVIVGNVVGIVLGILAYYGLATCTEQAGQQVCSVGGIDGVAITAGVLALINALIMFFFPPNAPMQSAYARGMTSATHTAYGFSYAVGGALVVFGVAVAATRILGIW